MSNPYHDSVGVEYHYTCLVCQTLIVVTNRNSDSMDVVHTIIISYHGWYVKSSNPNRDLIYDKAYHFLFDMSNPNNNDI